MLEHTCRSWKKVITAIMSVMLSGNGFLRCHKLVAYSNRNFCAAGYQQANFPSKVESAGAHFCKQYLFTATERFRVARRCAFLVGGCREQLTHTEIVRPDFQSYTSAWLRSRSNSTVANASRAAIVGVEESASSFDSKAYIVQKTKAVNNALDIAVPLKYPEKIHEAMRHSLLSPGKRVVALMCISACELVGGLEDISMPTACALEMLHAMSLIHDDLPCMDNGDLRRGLPACHKAFGEDIAVLAGDALLTLAFEYMTKTPSIVPSERIVRCIAHVAKSGGSEGCVAGQVVDLASEGDPNVSLETLEYIHMHKSAVLAETAAACGAILGGGTEQEIEALSNFARFLGLLHQVKDDILDVTRNTQELGKTARKDEMLDKATYPKLLGLQESQEFVHELARKAKGYLSQFDRRKAAPLYSLVEYLVHRQS